MGAHANCFLQDCVLERKRDCSCCMGVGAGGWLGEDDRHRVGEAAEEATGRGLTQCSVCDWLKVC
jgi:hypothetical protein